MLQVNPSVRPSADKLLQSSTMLKKSEELSLDASETATSISQLLRTIRMPKNLHYLTDRLPKANYMRELENIAVTSHKSPLSPEKSASNVSSLHPNLPKL